MLYRKFKVNIIIKEESLWDIQKNIEEEEKWVPKKEELEKKTRKSNFY